MPIFDPCEAFPDADVAAGRAPHVRFRFRGNGETFEALLRDGVFHVFEFFVLLMR